ncbi:hypothetical protein J6590_030915 [Homalodisca vitripennis]|nr:hypothetical protein J6590_030915 [Homalodisca vitripennis]
MSCPRAIVLPLARPSCFSPLLPSHPNPSKASALTPHKPVEAVKQVQYQISSPAHTVSTCVSSPWYEYISEQRGALQTRSHPSKCAFKPSPGPGRRGVTLIKTRLPLSTTDYFGRPPSAAARWQTPNPGYHQVNCTISSRTNI